ncbi:Zinc finger protein 112 [Eumeta japonica]|uniref:Zinc finger protein 112 n=1 Tax=Eumeta variegata TaxID=151549 RepID=A0A4C1YCG7_EUMVA|nr:Zinc finger protein 112 [Eumeta japonica]
MMKAEKLSILEHLLQQRRRGLVNRESAGTPILPRDTIDVQEYNEMLTMTIKTENNGEDGMAMQAFDMAQPLQNDPKTVIDLFIREEDNLYEKAENEVDDTVVKQELDIEPTLLQPKTTPCPFPSPNQTALDIHSSISSRDDSSLVLLRPALTSSASLIKAEVCNCGDSLELPLSATFLLDTRRRIDYACLRILKEQAYKRLPTGTSQGEQHGNLEESKAKIDPHKDHKKYECEYSKYSVTNIYNIVGHVGSQIDGKPCGFEQHEFSMSHLDDSKKRTHMPEKSYKCEQCEYSAHRLGDLKKHIRIHTGEKPYKCEYCSYSASRSEHLKMHMRAHMGERPYKCERCDYSASQANNLRRHMRTHTG